MKRPLDSFLVSLLATCLWALLGLPAAWLELREDPHHAASYGERLFAFQAANAAVAAGIWAAGWRMARRGGKNKVVFSILAAAWANALLLVQPSLLSPQSTALVLCQTTSILFSIAVSVRPVRWLTGLHLSFLAAASVLLLVEAYVGLVVKKRLPDYGEVMGSPGGAPFSAGGLLKPDLDLEVIGDGPDGVVRVVTNSAGFRSRRDFTPLPSGAVTRILFAGDSFFAGYRVDQEDSVGAVLERKLNERGRRSRGPDLQHCESGPVLVVARGMQPGLRSRPARAGRHVGERPRRMLARPPSRRGVPPPAWLGVGAHRMEEGPSGDRLSNASTVGSVPSS